MSCPGNIFGMVFKVYSRGCTAVCCCPCDINIMYHETGWHVRGPLFWDTFISLKWILARIKSSLFPQLSVKASHSSDFVYVEAKRSRKEGMHYLGLNGLKSVGCLRGVIWSSGAVSADPWGVQGECLEQQAHKIYSVPLLHSASDIKGAACKIMPEILF